jgi:hypothetical protein
MITLDLQNIDLKKYKRFFAFGCSFTQYHWPTWADILSKEIPDVDYYNFGLCGGGNLMMSTRIAEANARYKFTEDDLVIVMWTTMCREDRYIRDNWKMSGNIFTSGEHDEAYLLKFADVKGYLVRDIGVIALATQYLKSLPCTGITLASVPFDHQQDPDDTSIAKVLEIYKDTLDLVPPSMYELEMNMQWENGHEYYNANHCKPGETMGDYHPNPLRYYNYLKKLGFPLTNTSMVYAIKSLSLLKNTKSIQDIDYTFKYLKLTQAKVKNKEML